LRGRKLLDIGFASDDFFGRDSELVQLSFDKCLALEGNHIFYKKLHALSINFHQTAGIKGMPDLSSSENQVKHDNQDNCAKAYIHFFEFKYDKGKSVPKTQTIISPPTT
jgi:hypothetical protein